MYQPILPSWHAHLQARALQFRWRFGISSSSAHGRRTGVRGLHHRKTEGQRPQASLAKRHKGPLASTLSRKLWRDDNPLQIITACRSLIVKARTASVAADQSASAGPAKLAEPGDHMQHTRPKHRHVIHSLQPIPPTCSGRAHCQGEPLTKLSTLRRNEWLRPCTRPCVSPALVDGKLSSCACPRSSSFKCEAARPLLLGILLPALHLSLAMQKHKATSPLLPALAWKSAAQPQAAAPAAWYCCPQALNAFCLVCSASLVSSKASGRPSEQANGGQAFAALGDVSSSRRAWHSSPSGEKNPTFAPLSSAVGSNFPVME